jgi:hypothetical protein
MDANDDDVEIQVEPDQEDTDFLPQQDDDNQGQDMDQSVQPAVREEDNTEAESRNDQNSPAKPGFDTNGMGMQGMGFNNPMMQSMMMMNGFPNMGGRFSIGQLSDRFANNQRYADEHESHGHVWRVRAQWRHERNEHDESEPTEHVWRFSKQYVAE